MKSYIVEKSAVKNNIQQVKKKAGDAIIYAVVKGGAYGLGLIPFSRLLREEGVTHFAVTETEEAEALRQNGFTSEEILMLRSTSDREELERLMDLGVICTIGSPEAAVALNGIAKDRGTVAEAHLKIDTGMGRYGFLPSETDKIISIYQYMTSIAISGAYTHFHSAFCDAKATRAQFDAFMSVINALHAKGYETGILHAANSSALFRYDYTRLDAVRVGSALLGRLSFKAKSNCGLQRVGYIEATLDDATWLPAKHPVGYGAAYKTKRPTRVGIVSVGYYSGFGLEKGRDVFRVRDCVRDMLSLMKAAVFGKRLYVKLAGKQAPVLGHVGMVHTAIDVSSIDAPIGTRVRMEANPLLIKGIPIKYV